MVPIWSSLSLLLLLYILFAGVVVLRLRRTQGRCHRKMCVR